MAKGMACPQSHCKHPMVATREDEQARGSWVTYHCNACGYDFKRFEEKPQYLWTS